MEDSECDSVSVQRSSGIVSDEGLRASELFFRLSRELLEIAGVLEKIDNALGEHAARVGLSPNVQSIDQSRQVVEDISRILVSVSAEERIKVLDGAFSVSRDVKLNSLRSRLMSQEFSGFLDSDEAGGVQLF